MKLLSPGAPAAPPATEVVPAPPVLLTPEPDCPPAPTWVVSAGSPLHAVPVHIAAKATPTCPNDFIDSALIEFLRAADEWARIPDDEPGRHQPMPEIAMVDLRSRCPAAFIETWAS